MNTTLTGFALLGGGALALALVTFPATEIQGALAHAFLRARPGEGGRRARAFWESVARNLVLLAALGAAVGFVAFLSPREASMPIVERLGEQVFGPWVVGLVLAALSALPASRGALPLAGNGDAEAGKEGEVEPRARGRWRRVETGLGYVLFAVVLALLVPTPGGRPGLRSVDWLLHGPAWLAVGAGALAIALYLGEPRRGRSVTIGLGGAGWIGALLGLLQAFHGFAHTSVETVAGGLVFAMSACVATLVGLGAVALPLEDEDRALGEGRAVPCRLVWYGFPLATVLVVAIAWVMVSTPMKMRP